VKLAGLKACSQAACGVENMRHGSSDEQRSKPAPTAEQRNRWQQTYRRRKKVPLRLL